MMKKFYFLLFALCLFSGVSAQIINFPDANFEAKLLAASTSNGTAKDLAGTFFKIDANSDGQIQVSEASQVSFLDVQGVYNEYITSLVGMSNFNNLQYLDCSNNHLTSLNLSGLTNMQYLECSINQLASLDVSGLINLQTLACGYNQLPSLNVNGLTNLQSLSCGNNQLPLLNVSGLTNLQTLSCASNQLPSLDVSGLTNLQSLDCANNQLPLLNVSGLTNLQNLSCGYNQLPLLNVSGLTNLQYLNCANNQLPLLNVSGLTNLLTLGCANNQLPSLDVSGLTNLQELNCDHNQLPSLDVSGLTNLQGLYCSNNQLSSVNVSGLTNLQSLYCSNNQLPSLNVSGLTNLQTFFCDHNQLLSLDVSGLPQLQYLDCNHNQLPSLDVTGSPQFNYLDCKNNLLTSILCKNGSNEYLDFSDNPNLQYMCADDSQISQVQNWITQNGYSNCTVNTYCSFTPGGIFYTIQGNNKIDSDNNGCDASDIIYPNFQLSITDGTLSGSMIANTTGAYSIHVGVGTHTITPVLENPSYFNISPSSTTIQFPLQSTPLTQNFCFTSNGVHPDLEVIILPLVPARPGFDAVYKIIYKNKGNIAQSGSVNLTFNDAVLDFISANAIPSNQITNTLTWSFTNLQPFETREITLTLNVNSPMETPPVNIGNQLNFTAVINPVTGDEIPGDNTFGLKQIVVGAYDPNDKTCLEGTTISPSMIGEYVHYMIRFENTGTFPAQNIVVKDVIDTTKFDISTLVPIKGSHSFVTRITEGNKVEFIFENIILPFDNATNDGYVAFKIKTLPTLVLGDSFDNTANIYFDYNFPIITNTASTTIQTLGTSDFEFSNYFTLYPNPAKEVLNIAVKNGVEMSSINIYNTLGQLVIAIPNAQTVSTIDVSRLTAGNYFIKMNTDKGTSNTKFIKN